MARKYDRYGRNRQFRRNPTRSRKFFPYQLPFQRDFRLLVDRNTAVSDLTAKKWLEHVGNKRKLGDKSDVSDFDDILWTQSPPIRQIGRDIRYGSEAMVIGEMPLAAIPIAGMEMAMNPKKVSQRFGGGVIGTTAGLGFLAAKNLI